MFGTGENDIPSDDPSRDIFLGMVNIDRYSLWSTIDKKYQRVCGDVRLEFFSKLLDDPTIALRPGKNGGVFQFAGSPVATGKIVHASPSRNIRHRASVVVTTGIVHVPVERYRIEPLVVQEVTERKLVQRHELLVLRTEFHGNTKGLPSVSTSVPFVMSDQGSEPFILIQIPLSDPNQGE